MIQTEGLKTILFDLDGTLRHSVPLATDVFIDFTESLNGPIPLAVRKAAIRWSHHYWADSECLLIDLQTYGRENEDFWVNYSRRQLEAAQVAPERAAEIAPLVQEHMRENYQPTDTIYDDVFPTLDALRETGLVVGIVTNRTNPVDEYLAENGLAEHVDFYFAAGEIGAWKPDAAIFYYALGLANAKPEQALYIGDNYFADVVGAQKAKIQPVLIDPQEVFEDAECTVIHTIGELQTHFHKQEKA